MYKNDEKKMIRSILMLIGTIKVIDWMLTLWFIWFRGAGIILHNIQSKRLK